MPRCRKNQSQRKVLGHLDLNIVGADLSQSKDATEPSPSGPRQPLPEPGSKKDLKEPVGKNKEEKQLHARDHGREAGRAGGVGELNKGGEARNVSGEGATGKSGRDREHDEDQERGEVAEPREPRQSGVIGNDQGEKDTHNKKSGQDIQLGHRYEQLGEKKNPSGNVLDLGKPSLEQATDGALESFCNLLRNILSQTRELRRPFWFNLSSINQHPHRTNIDVQLHPFKIESFQSSADALPLFSLPYDFTPTSFLAYNKDPTAEQWTSNFTQGCSSMSYMRALRGSL